MPAPKLSPELKDRYTREYLELLDRIDALKEEIREEIKERKGEVATLEKAAYRLRRLLAGKEDDQLEVPGSEIPHPKPRRSDVSISFTSDDLKKVGEGAAALEVSAKKKGGRRG